MIDEHNLIIVGVAVAASIYTLHVVFAPPVIHENETIGLITVGNKPTDYEQADLELLESMSNYVAPILGVRLRKVETARHESGDERQRMQVQMLRGEEMQNIGVLAGQIAHELNVWIATILEHADTSSGQPSGERSLDKTGQYIHDACVRSINLSRQLLLFRDVVLPD